MGVYLRNKRWWIQYPHPSTGKAIRKPTGIIDTGKDSKKLAEAIHAKKLVEIAEDKFMDVKHTSDVTLEDYIDPFINGNSKPKGNRAWQEDKRILQHILKTGNKNKSGVFSPVFPQAIKLADLGPIYIDNYETTRLGEHWQEGEKTPRPAVSNSTVNRYLDVLSSLLSYALKKGIIDKNILYKRTSLPENPARERHLSDAELDWVSVNAPRVSIDLYDLMICYINLGFRKAEVTSLEWEMIDFNNNSILLTATNNKSKKKRYQPMNKMLREVLLRRKMTRDPLSKFVFPAVRKKDSGKDFTKEFNKLRALAAKANGIADFTIHDLRRSFATKALKQSKGNLIAVKKLLGHASASTTERYVFTPDQDLADVVEMVGFDNSTKMTHPNRKSEKEQFNNLVSQVDIDS